MNCTAKVTERTREIEVQKHLLAQRSDALEQQNKMLNRQKGRNPLQNPEESKS